MGMKPRLGDKAGKIGTDLSTQANTHPGEETSPNVSGAVTSAKPESNHKLDPNLVSGPKTHGG